MCVNYIPASQAERFLKVFGVGLPDEDWKHEVWPRYVAPILRRDPEAIDFRLQAIAARWGLVPWWAPKPVIGWNTVNAKHEELGQKRSYRDPWKRGQRCIVPMEALFEPCYESGAHIRSRIWRADQAPMGVAGLWEMRKPKDGEDGAELLTFTAITIDATGHPLMSRMHKPDDAKRMLAILDETEYSTWLEAPVDQAEQLLDQYPAELLTDRPDPTPPRVRKQPTAGDH